MSSQTPQLAQAATSDTRERPLFDFLFRRVFGTVRFPEEAAERLQELAARGTLVYVMRSAGILNFLYFNWVLGSLGLPLARAVLGLPAWLLAPLCWLFRQRPRGGPDEVVGAAARGEASMVFLRRPAILRVRGTPADDPFGALVALQRESERPIFVVPQILIFKRAPVRLKPGIKEAVLGSAEVPGKLHAFVSFFANRKRAFVQVGRAINLRRVVAAEGALDDALVARKVRGSLAVGLARELRAVVGPPLKPTQRVIAEALRDRSLRAELEREAARSGRSVAQVEREARGALQEIAASYAPAVLDGAHTLARWIFARLFDRIHVDDDGLRAAADASKRAPLVICPTHRSHVDYLLMSHVMVERGMTPPLVAAGANLSFWPLGPLFRRTGAYFIRRSFRGEHIYAASLTAYVRKLIRDGNTQEFFLEGGRSRTGRILPPRLGLLTMQVEAWLAGVRDDLHFVPVAIDYARLMESGSFARELAGGEKVRESLTALLKTPAVLGRRWGEVYIQVAPPISLATFAAARGIRPGPTEPDRQRELVRELAQQISAEMGRVQTVTASALVAAGLLGSPGKAVGGKELRRRVELLHTLARAEGARFPPELEGGAGDPGSGPLLDAIARFVRDRLVESQRVGGETFHRVRDDARGSLAFYKNGIVHHVREEAILATSLLSFPGLAPKRDALRERVCWLSRLLQQELPAQGRLPEEEAFETALERLKSLGLIAEGEEGLRAPPEALSPLAFLRTLIWDLLEAYLLLATEAGRLEAGPAERKALVRGCFEKGRQLQRTGWVLFPEALNAPTFEQILRSLVDQGYLEAEDGRIALGARWATAEARQAFSRELLRFTR